MSLKRVAAIALTGVLSVGAAGCAQNSPNQISAKGAATLHPYVVALRQAAAGTDIDTVRTAESELITAVERLPAGELSAKRAQNIEDAAETLLSDFTARNTVTPTTPPVTPTTPPVTPTTPGPIVTVTVTPTQTTTVTPTDSTPAKGDNGKGNGGNPGQGGNN